MSGLKRDTIDKFYTNINVVDTIFTHIDTILGINKDDLVIEPSAGNGAFINVINKLSNDTIFLDIKPEHPLIKEQNYLEFTPDTNKKIHIIGNPPFGRQSSLAIKFIKHSTSFCDTISFILPKSFKKDSMKKHFNPYFHLEFETDLLENSFLLNDTTYNVPCVFQIWIKKDYKREIPLKLEPIGWKFVNKQDNPDISFRRVGVYAGKIDTEIESKSVQSHYFIKFEKDTNIDHLQLEFKSSNDTVGPKSISKQELIKELNLKMI